MMLVHEDARGSGVGSHLEGVEPHSCHMISPGTIYSYIYIDGGRQCLNPGLSVARATSQCRRSRSYMRLWGDERS